MVCDFQLTGPEVPRSRCVRFGHDNASSSMKESLISSYDADTLMQKLLIYGQWRIGDNVILLIRFYFRGRKTVAPSGSYNHIKSMILIVSRDRTTCINMM
jgi:hypothetical protein